MTELANPLSVKSRLKNEAEKAIANWDESKPMPKRIVITISKKNPNQPPTLDNVTATVELEYQ
jgi:hypothetical protein